MRHSLRTGQILRENGPRLILFVLLLGINTTRISASEPGEIVVVKDSTDSIHVFTASGLKALSPSFSERIGGLRLKGIGASAGLLPGVLALDIRPVVRAVKHSVDNVRFRVSGYGYEPVYISAKSGYAGFGTGLRIGGFSARGYTEIVGESFGAGDLFALLRVDLRYGGFLIEKALTKGPLTIAGGGCLGGGTMKLEVSYHHLSGYSAFHTPVRPWKSFGTGLAIVEAHGALSCSLHALVHAGVELTLPVFFSLGGFSPHQSSFATLNPGFGIKLLFGILG